MGDLSKNFSRIEFECNCKQCGFDTVDVELLKILQWLREVTGKVIYITSACRCPVHNANEGGSIHSQHLYGRAADIVVGNMGAKEVHDILDKNFAEYVSLGLYEEMNFVHVDTRTNGGKRWA